MAKLTQNKLAGMIATKENGLSQAKVGDVNQCLKILKKMLLEEAKKAASNGEVSETLDVLFADMRKAGFRVVTHLYPPIKNPIVSNTETKKLAKKKK